jgi:putative endonuclease
MERGDEALTMPSSQAMPSSPGLTGRPSTPETVYIGVTNDLVRRVAEHRLKSVKSLTKKYGVDRLVYFEQFDDAENAIRREKLLKKWNRAWKIRLIEEFNPNWGRFVFEHRWSVSVPRHTRSPSCPAKAGHPVIRGGTLVNSGFAEYWIVRLRGR